MSVGLLCLILTGCPAQSTDDKHSGIQDHVINKGTVEFARGFRIEYHSDYKKVTITNPWQGAEDIVYEYYLVAEGTPVKNFPPGSTIIRIPVKRIICMSTTHIGMLEFIGRLDALVGVSGSNLVNNEFVREGIRKGKIIDIGYDRNILFEDIVMLRPDLVMTYGIGSEVAGYINKLEELGVPVLINGDYLEHTPLAKAEWVKFFAALFNEEERTDEKFENITEEYDRIRKLITNVVKRPKVMIGLPWKDTWFIPGGKSFAANFIMDAGGDYLWKSKNSHEAIPFDIEVVYEQAQIADVWINPGAARYHNEILSVDSRLANFKAFKEGEVYNNSRIINNSGGNDYWETGVMEPQVILKDLVNIMHPGLLPDHELVYYMKILAEQDH